MSVRQVQHPANEKKPCEQGLRKEQFGNCGEGSRQILLRRICGLLAMLGFDHPNFQGESEPPKILSEAFLKAGVDPGAFPLRRDPPTDRSYIKFPLPPLNYATHGDEKSRHCLTFTRDDAKTDIPSSIVNECSYL